MKHLKKVLIILVVCLMSFSLGISPLVAAEPIEDIHGNVVYVYSEQEHRYVIAGLEELQQWREAWPQFQVNYNNLMDSNNIWKENYAKEADKNYDLRLQRNVMVGLTGGLTLGGIIITAVYFLFGS